MTNKERQSKDKEKMLLSFPQPWLDLKDVVKGQNLKQESFDIHIHLRVEGRYQT